MKDIPLTMTPGNVLATLAGRKTETRRIIDPPLTLHDFGCGNGPVLAFTGPHLRPGLLAVGLSVLKEPGNSSMVRCRYEPGDRVWIQEHYRIFEDNPSGRWVQCEYLADGHKARVRLTPEEWAKFRARKRPPGSFVAGRFMFRSLARIVRPVEEVRAELLQDISTDSAEAEGSLFWWNRLPKRPGEGKQILHPKAAFRELWQSIHGPGSWAKNPPVWAIRYSEK